MVPPPMSPLPRKPGANLNGFGIQEAGNLRYALEPHMLRLQVPLNPGRTGGAKLPAVHTGLSPHGAGYPELTSSDLPHGLKLPEHFNSWASTGPVHWKEPEVDNFSLQSILPSTFTEPEQLTFWATISPLHLPRSGAGKTLAFQVTLDLSGPADGYLPVLSPGMVELPLILMSILSLIMAPPSKIPKCHFPVPRRSGGRFGFPPR